MAGNRHEGNLTVSIDPSSIPNFGGQPDPEPRGPAGSVVIPDQDLVKQLLDQMELKYLVDDEGDLAAPWEEFRTYFMFRGEGEQAGLRGPHLLRPPVHRRRQAAAARGHRRLEPPHPVAEGLHPHPRRRLVRLIGEAQMLIGLGVGLEHFVSTHGELGARVDRVRQVGRRELGLEQDDATRRDGAEGGDSGSGDEGTE